jgi:hypothetical protein
VQGVVAEQERGRPDAQYAGGTGGLDPAAFPEQARQLSVHGRAPDGHPGLDGAAGGGIVAGLAGWPVSVGAFQGEAGPVGDRLGADEPKAAVLGLQVLDGAVADGGYLFGIVWSLPRLGWDRLAGGLGAPR